MSKRPIRSRRKKQPAASPVIVTVSPEAVTLRWEAGDGPRRIALVIDGATASMAEASSEDGTTLFHLPIPSWSYGQVASVLSVPDGALIALPIAFGERRRLGSLQWSCAAGIVSGSFQMEGDLAPVETPAMLMELVEDDVVRPIFAEPAGAGEYRFTTVLTRLPKIDVPTKLQLRVAGTTLAPELSATLRESGLVGYIEPTDQPFIQGWLADAAEPARSVDVELAVDGDVVWTGPANLFREDVRDFGLSEGRSGYHFPLPKSVRRANPVTISARVAGTTTHLANSPYVLPALAPFVGYFDSLEGPFAGGWVVNMHDPHKPLRVEAVCDGAVIGAGVAELFRGDVEQAGMPTARCGFRFIMERPLSELYGRDVYVRIAGTDQILSNSPQQINQNSNIVRFLTRKDSIAAPTLDRLRRQMAFQAGGTIVSILMPVFNTRREWLVEALNSVLAQWSPNWQLICVDDGSTEPHVAEILAAAARHDPRIRVMRSAGNLGIARAINFGLRAARGEYVAFMDHDDTLEPDAVHRLITAARRTGADLLYSDEAITTEDINSIVEVRARPAFSYDYYLSHPYFVHLICARTSLAWELNGWDESLSISADVDFVLRMAERARVVTHVPAVLYRWRTHDTSTGHSKQLQVTDTMMGVLDRHLERQGFAAKASPGLRYNEYRINWPDDGREVLVVIPTKNRVELLKTAIDSVEKTSKGVNCRIVVIDHESTDPATVRYLRTIGKRHTVMPYSGPFNYARMNNLAVRQHGGEAGYVLLLNNDVEAREQGWIPRMRSLAGRPDVGAVGCLLLYGDDRVQHAGVLMAFSGAADHAMKFKDAYLDKGKRHPGYNCNLTSVRDYSAVTAACLMVRREVFDAVDGFDEEFAIGFNDTDLCLRIGAAGFKVLYDGFTVLYHHESATRTTTNEVAHPEDDARLRKRWAKFFQEGDPFYSPLLAPRGADHALRQDQGCKGRMRERAVEIQSLALVDAPERAKPARRMKTGRSAS